MIDQYVSQSPVNQNPIDLGLMFVSHSCPQNIMEVHSDILAGAVASTTEHMERIFFNLAKNLEVV